MPKYTETCERQNQTRPACSHVARGAPYFHFRMWLRKGKYLYSPAVMPREDAENILQLVFVFVSLLCSLGEIELVMHCAAGHL